LKIGKYAQAADFYTMALESLDKLGEPYIISRMIVLGNLSQVTIQLGNLKIARQYIDQYERILINNPNQKKQLKLYTLESQISLKGKNYQQALDFINSAYELQKTLAKDKSSLAEDRVIMSIIINRLEILLEMNNLRQVKKNLLEVETLLKRTPDPFSQAKVSLIRSMFYYTEGHLKKAVKVGEKNAVFCLKYNFIRELDQIYSNLSTWYSELNQSELSLKYYRKRAEVWKKNLSRDLPAEIMTIIMNYEQKKLSNEIRNLKGFNIWMILLMCGITILIILFFMYIIKRSKRRNLMGLIKLEKDHLDQLSILQKKLSKHENKVHKKDLYNGNVESIMYEVLTIIENEKLFLNDKISLELLASRLNVNRTYLSKAINKYWKNNFNDLINSYRVNEAKRLLSNPQEAYLTIIQIGNRSGFNSKSSFNRIFREKTKMSPKQYRECKTKNEAFSL
jgi:AraC-like DNA-binding protein